MYVYICACTAVLDGRATARREAPHNGFSTLPYSVFSAGGGNRYIDMHIGAVYIL